MSSMMMRAANAVISAMGLTWAGRVRGDEGLNLGYPGTWDSDRLYSAVELGREQQFPPAAVQRGELYTRTDLMIHSLEVFRYQLGPKHANGFQPIQLETWSFAPTWHARRHVVADLFAVSLNLGSVIFCTNVLVKRDVVVEEDFPAAIETGDGLGYTIDRTSWITYLQFKSAPIEGISIDTRLLYLLLVNRRTMGQITLEEFSVLPLETINDLMISTCPGEVWERPSPQEAGLRDLKVVDEETLVIVSESDDSSIGSPSSMEGVRGEPEKGSLREEGASGIEFPVQNSSTSVDPSTSSMGDSKSFNLGESPNLSTEGIPNLQDWAQDRPRLASSAKKKLYPGDILGASEGGTATTRCLGRVFFERVYPGSSQRFVDEVVSYILSGGRDDLMARFGKPLFQDQQGPEVHEAAGGVMERSASDWEMLSVSYNSPVQRDMRNLLLTEAYPGEIIQPLEIGPNGREIYLGISFTGTEIMGPAESTGLENEIASRPEDTAAIPKRVRSPSPLMRSTELRAKRSKKSRRQREKARKQREKEEKQLEKDQEEGEDLGSEDERILKEELKRPFLAKAGSDEIKDVSSSASSSSISEPRASPLGPVTEEEDDAMIFEENAAADLRQICLEQGRLLQVTFEEEEALLQDGGDPTDESL